MIWSDFLNLIRMCFSGAIPVIARRSCRWRIAQSTGGQLLHSNDFYGGYLPDSETPLSTGTSKQFKNHRANSPLTIQTSPQECRDVILWKPGFWRNSCQPTFPIQEPPKQTCIQLRCLPRSNIAKIIYDNCTSGKVFRNKFQLKFIDKREQGNSVKQKWVEYRLVDGTRNAKVFPLESLLRAVGKVSWIITMDSSSTWSIRFETVSFVIATMFFESAWCPPNAIFRLKCRENFPKNSLAHMLCDRVCAWMARINRKCDVRFGFNAPGHALVGYRMAQARACAHANQSNRKRIDGWKASLNDDERLSLFVQIEIGLACAGVWLKPLLWRLDKRPTCIDRFHSNPQAICRRAYSLPQQHITDFPSNQNISFQKQRFVHSAPALNRISMQLD